MKKADLHVGDRVRVKERVEGYYSDYGGNPSIFLEPNMVGVVGAIDVPSVCREGVSFVCVDFFCPVTRKTERAAVYYPNICKVRRRKPYWKSAEGDKTMHDPTESIRRERLAEINAEPGSREALEAQYGQVWDTTQLGEDFEVIGFMAPLVVVRRKSDGIKGSLEFQHFPRWYFNFAPHRKDR